MKVAEGCCLESVASELCEVGWHRHLRKSHGRVGDPNHKCGKIACHAGGVGKGQRHGGRAAAGVGPLARALEGSAVTYSAADAGIAVHLKVDHSSFS